MSLAFNDFPSPQDFVDGEMLLLDKPLEWTSFQAVNYVRWRLKKYTGLKKIKVGHAGTLDPLASGLLIICTGKKTKEIAQFMGLDKVYTGTIQLGATRPSADLETDIDATWPTDHLSASMVLEAMGQLTGEIEQIPPVYSALKVEGKRLYEHARKGSVDAVEIKARPVNIHRFALLRYEEEQAAVHFEVQCSKGTYIRSLARDLGSLLQNGAHLTALRRTAIGPWKVTDATVPSAWGNRWQEAQEAFNRDRISE